VKKQNIRVQRKAGSKTASVQSPNKPEAAAPETTGAKLVSPNCIGLLFIQDVNGNGQEITGLEYSAAEFAEINRVASANGETLAQFLESAVKDKLAKERRDEQLQTLVRGLCMIDLEFAVDQAEALTLLFREHVVQTEHAGWNENINNGFVLLTAETFAKLRAAVADVDQYGNQLKHAVGL